MNEVIHQYTLYNEYGLNVLHVAAKEGNEATVTLLLSALDKHPHLANEVIDSPTNNDKEQTALHLAVLNNRLKVAKCLIEYGTNVNAKDKALVSALSYAARAGYEPIVHYLVNNGADVNSVDQHGMTPVHHAVKCGQWNVVRCLVEHEADLNVADERGATPVSGMVKEGEWDMVRYLLENGALLISLSDEVKQDVFRRFVNPGSDTEGQFNQAVKLGNVEILNMLISNYINQSDVNAEELLAKTYDHLKLCNLRLNQNICNYIENKLLYYRFYSDNRVRDKQNGEGQIDLNNVNNRIKLVIGCIDCISAFDKDNKINETFLFIGKFISHNFQILKVQLSFTYGVLPWEEIQFCLITFLLCYNNPNRAEIINKLIMYKQRLLFHLKLFSEKLESLEIIADEKTFKDKKKMDRESAVSYILKLTPEFTELYQNYEILKDVYSLNRIATHINIACGIDLNAKPLIGQLAIERALQVIGECLKNTLISPNMSDSVQNMLIQNAPLNVKQIVTSLRDSLSHVDTLSKRVDIENDSDPDFFTKMQDDLKKLESEINFILFSRKIEAVKLFLKRILECKNIDQVRSITCRLTSNEKESIVISEQFHKSFYTIVKLIQDFQILIEEKTKFQIQCFQEIYKIINKNKARIEELQNEHARILTKINQLVNLVAINTSLETIKMHVKGFLSTFNLKSFANSVYEKILDLTQMIYDEMRLKPNLKLEVKTMYHKIFSTIEFECRRIKIIDAFKMNFDKEDDERKKQVIVDQIKDKIDSKLAQFIDEISDEETRDNFKEEFKRKKKVHKVKQIMVQFYKKKCRKEIDNLNQFIKMFNKLNLKLVKKETHSSLYELKDDSSCQKLVQRVNRCEDSYGKLVKKLTDEPMNEFMQEAFIDFIESFHTCKKLEPDFVNSSRRLFYDSKIYFHNIKTIDSILGTDKSDEEILNILRANDDVRVAIEMLMLTLTEILENINLLETNRLFLDEHAPILIGKNLRNYLAHGDLLMDVLSIDHLKSIISHYRILKLNCDQHKSNVYTNDYLISKVTSEDISKLKENYRHKLELIKEKRELFLSVFRKDADAIHSIFHGNVEIRVRLSYGWTLLHYAAQNDNEKLFKFFLEKNLNIYQKDVYGDSIISYLPQFGSTKILQSLIKTNSLDLDSNLDYGKTLLHLAAQNNRGQMVKLLVKNGANIEAIDNDGSTPIQLSAINGHVDVVLILLKAGANINTKNNNGATLVHLSAMSNFPDLTNYLLNHGLNADMVNNRKETPLHLACSLGYNDVVTTLLDRNVNVNAIREDGVSPLHLAAQEGYEQVIEILLTNGAVINAITTLGQTALHMAAVKGYERIVEALLKHGADVEAKNIYGSTALDGASIAGHHEVVKILLENKANVNALAEGETALHAAAQHNHPDTVKILIDYKADVNIKNRNGLTALHFAAQSGSVDVLKLLLGFGSSVNEVTNDGSTPLLIATMFNKVEAVKLLVKQKVDIDAADDDGATPLFYACLKGYFDIVKILKENKADIAKRDQKGWTPLHVAVQNGHRKIVEILTKSDIKRSSESELEFTPLHTAATYGHVDMINILLERKLEIDKSNKDGFTALHLASKYGHNKVVELLLSKQANIDLVNSHSENALHLAAKFGHKDVIEVILNKTKINIDIAHGDKATPLHLASSMGHGDVVKFLLDNGANINATAEKEKWTALHLAADKGHHSIVDSLLRKGARVNAQLLTNKTTPLHLATHYGNNVAVSLMLLQGADVNAVFGLAHSTALHVAAEFGRIDIALNLLSHGACVDAWDVNNETPLHRAAENNQMEMILVLCKFNADVNAKDEKKCTPLHVAAFNGFYDFFVNLCNCGANIYDLTDTGWSVMHIASQNGHFNVIKKLLSLDKSSIMINQAGVRGESPLHLSASNGHSGIVQLLLENGANNNHSECMGFTALHGATIKGHVDTFQCLLKNKVNTELKSLLGQTPLHWATTLGHEKIVRMLCDAGANANNTTSSGYAPLHFAVEFNYIKIANILIETGADVNASLKDKITPLHLASTKGNFDVAKLLVEAGASVNCKNITEYTPLHLSAQNNHTDIINFLLINKADIDTRLQTGFTALQLAMMNSHMESVKALLTFHADVFAKNNHDSVLHQAVKNDEILKLIVAEIKSKSNGERLRSVMNAGDLEEDTPLMWAAESGYLSSAQLLLKCEEVDINKQNLDGRTALHWAALNGHLEIVNLLINERADVNVKEVNGATAFDLAYQKISVNEKYEAICAVFLSLSLECT